MNRGFGHVAFIECSPSGHRPKYVELLAAFTNAKFFLSAAVLEAMAPALCEQLEQENRVHVLASSAHGAFLTELAASLEQNATDERALCFLMVDDYLGKCPGKFLEFIAVKRRPIFSGLLLDSTFCYPRWRSPKGWARLVLRMAWAAALRFKNPGFRVFALDEEVLAYLKWAGFRREQLCAVPDPALIDYSRAATTTPRAGSVLFFGRHTPRKGTAWALAALCENASVREIRLVGEIIDREAVEAALGRLPSRLVVTKVNRIVSDEEAAEEFARAAVVAAPYEDFGSSSNVVLNAWCFGKSVVYPDYGMMAQLTRRYHGGFLYRPRDARDFNRAVSEALAASSEGDAAAALRDRVTTAHSKQAFVLALQRGLRESVQA